MVQYIFTPWRDREELFLVRDQLYGEEERGDGDGDDDSTTRTRASDGDNDNDNDIDIDRRARQNLAVARISMWVQRGNCPHMVESTALLLAAVLGDERAAAEGEGEGAGSSGYAVRAAYAAAFSRFVTGLLDGLQDKLRKQSMYALAKGVGLPATFVELRHQATHEQLPSLARLRPAARKALGWIWDYYWKQLTDSNADAQAGGGGTAAAGQDACRAAVLGYLGQDDEHRRRAMMARGLRRWEEQRLVAAVDDLQASLPGNQVFLKCTRLKQELRVLRREQEAAREAAREREGKSDGNGGSDRAAGRRRRSLSLAQVEEARDQASDDDGLDDGGWCRYKGVWKAKPIGVV